MTSVWRDDEVDHFFEWFRTRALTIEQLRSQRRTIPDASILRTACLDALANYWADAFGQSFGSDRRRFGEFLQQFGPNCFERISGPDLRERARAISPVTPFASAVASTVPEELTSVVRTWQKDPTLAELTSSPALIRAYPSKTGLVEWLKDSRYGERVYKLYRCNWIHEVAESREAGVDVFERLKDEPGYQNLFDPASNSHRRRLILPEPFLAKTFAVALANFEATCRAQRINPMPPW